MLVHPKDKTPDAQKCGLVYQVEFPECSLTYIGETGRMLATRMKDHLNLRNPLTAVGEHCAHEHHTITKDSVRVLAREDGWLKRKVREAIEIKIGQPAMNRDQGYELPPHLRWTSAVMWSSSRRSRDLGGVGTLAWRKVRDAPET